MKTNTFSLKLVASALVLTAVLLTTTSSQAGLPDKVAVTHQKSIQEKLSESIQFPDDSYFKIPNGETALVLFTLDDEGKVVVDKIDCNNEDMKESLRTQMNQVVCDNVIHPYKQQYQIRIKFLKY